MDPKGQIVKKGFNPDVDSYSAFFDNKKLGKTNMEELIREKDVTDLYICGIATDVCVGNTRLLSQGFLKSSSPAFTAFHSQELGFRTILVEDASRGIQVKSFYISSGNFPHCQIQVQSFYSFNMSNIQYFRSRR